MIDSTRIQGSSGLATALKDRSTCSIPVQPNRSLPVRPAPHIPCRAIISKKITNNQTTSNTVNIPTSPFLPSSQGTLTSTSLSSQTPSSSPSSLSSSSSQSLTNNVPQQFFRCTLDLTKIDVPNLQNTTCKSIINIVEAKKCYKKNNQNISKRLGTKRKPDDGYNKQSYVHHLIDITKSPERHGVDDLYSTTHINNNNITSNECGRKDVNIGKKRRKKGKKSDDEDINKLKIPPLRLKKIRSLQKNQMNYIESTSEDRDSKTLAENEKPLSVTTFRYYQSVDQEESHASEDIRPISKEHASKYRIVTGQTPPYNEQIDSSTVSNKDVKELRCHQNKLKVKLRELKKKTVELSRVMLKTALTSSCTPARETIDSYSEQIEKLTNLLKMIPEVTTQGKTDCEKNQDNVKLSSQVLSNNTNVCSSVPKNNENNVSTFNNLPSPEPPKLSPKITVNYESTNPNQIRNSPPHLPIATDNDWENCELFQKFFKQGDDMSKPYGNIDSRDSSTASPIITTTTGSIISEEVHIEDKPEYFDLTFLEMPKTEVHIDTVQNNDNEGSIGEFNMHCEVGEILKIDLRRSPSPEEMIIDSTNTFHNSNKTNDDCDDNSSDKSLHIDVDFNEENDTNINEICNRKKLSDTSTVQSIKTSSCNIPSAQAKVLSVENAVNGGIDSNIAMSNQFPTLGSWLEKISTKLRNQLSKSSTYDTNNFKQSLVINNNNNNNEVPVYDQNQNFNQELPKKVNNAVTFKANSIIEPEIKNQQWHEQQQKQQSQIVQRTQNDNLIKSTPSTSPSIHKKPQEVEQPVYPQVLMDRYYPRNYPMDPYRAPLIHSPNIQNGQLPDLQNGPRQYHINPPVASMANPMSMTQNSGLSYWQSTVQKTLQDPKRIYSNMPFGYDPMALSKRAVYPQMHPMMAPMVTNFVNQPFQQMHNQHQQRQQQQLHPSQQQQMNYDRMWQKPTICLQPSDAQMPPMNYPPPWRGPLLLGPENLAAGRNYGLNNNWTSDPCNLLSTLAPTALQNLTTSYQVGPRVRNVKERKEQNRSCETPHLAKVTYSPNTAKTYACSNCGLRGPLFKCLGCEKAYYCDESCQARHWSRHVLVCPKKMPKLKKVLP